MKDLKRCVEILIFWLLVTWDYFFQGFKNHRFLSHLKNYVKEFLLHLEMFSKFIQEYKDFEELQTSKHERLKNSACGLHQLLKKKDLYSYSILLIVDKPLPDFLRASLESALNLTAPHLEVLIGLRGKQNTEVEDLIKEFKNKFPYKLKEFLFESHNHSMEESLIINSLAEKAKGNYLFILQQGDWLRPDLLYRYEQTLNFYPNPEKIVLFCDEYLVDQNYTPIPRSRTNKPQAPPFPYIFNDFLSHTLLIPKSLWEVVGGFQVAYEGVHTFDLPLRLDEKGAQFEKIPVHLYAVQNEYKKKRENNFTSPDIFNRLIHSFESYVKNKKLDWQWQRGYSKNSLRALPTLKKIPSVHVVMLYKNQHNVTLSAVEHLLKQVGVELKITAIDNGSSDISIAKKLTQMGVEVIRVDEPFNYSRLNNLAISQTAIGNACESILFINNDVDLDPQALLEMCRWVDQPGIGMVGCRLNYPNGLLQHGGVIIESTRAAFIKSWHHEERTEKFDRLEKANVLRVCAAVTAACCLVKRKTFLEVGGFDEMWFPVAFSDTALAVKIRALGLHCFYTPFAIGIHHESISRKKVNIEDYESLTWAHRKFVCHLWKGEKIHFKDLINTEY